MNAVTHPGDAHLRARISRMARVGTPEIQIAFAINICVRTLQLFYSTELQHAAIELNLQVLETLARFATSGKHPAATIFWAKTRCGFTPPVPPKKTSTEFPPAPQLRITGPKGQYHVTGPDGVRRTVGPDGEPWEEDF
jgi:hypothetical protein